MTLSSNIRSFAYIGPILDAALKAGGGRFVLQTKAQAVRWRAEAYHYRKLLKKESEDSGLPPVTPYDYMRLTIEDTTVVIGKHHLSGTLMDNAANVLEPEVAPDDPLQAQADALARQLLGEK